MKLIKYLTLFSIVFSISILSIQAQDFTYRPTNPAFGGSYLNYSWLLNSAQVQNEITDPATETDDRFGDRFDRDPLADFEQDLNRQILNQLSRRIVGDQFGEDSLNEGSYTIGSYQIEITEGSGGLDIIILDSATGNQTSLFVPYY